MLYGMAEPVKQAMLRLGFPVRDYVPIGALVPGMAYLVRRLLENTSNEGFLRRTFVERLRRLITARPPAIKAINGLTITGSIVIVFPPRDKPGGPDSCIDQAA